jgi:hypothetical protein
MIPYNGHVYIDWILLSPFQRHVFVVVVGLLQELLFEFLYVYLQVLLKDIILSFLLLFLLLINPLHHRVALGNFVYLDALAIFHNDILLDGFLDYFLVNTECSV